MSTLLQDLRYALRLLRRSPGFTVVAVLTLALGIGANTAIFSVVNAVLVQRLPYRDSSRLVNIWNDYGSGGQSLPAVSAPDFRDYQRKSRLFEEFAAGTGGTVGLTGEGDPEQVEDARVTANFFPLLGVHPLLGRNFSESEAVLNGPSMAILTYGLWQRRFGGDSGVIGRTVLVDGTAHEIIGVLPPDFQLLLPAEQFMPADAELWRPMQLNYDAIPRNFTGLTVLGRLKPGVTLAQAQAELDSIAADLRAEFAVHQMSGLRIRAVPLHHDVVKHVQPALLVLLGAVGLVLLIACGNVAHLLLARSLARSKEIAIREALGASRLRIARQVLSESLLLALAGGMLGLLIAQWGWQLLLTLDPAGLPRLQEIGLDTNTLLFTAAASLLTVFLFGLGPALQAFRSDLNQVLKQGGRGSGVGSHPMVRRLLVAGEVTLSVVLLIGTGLLLRSFLELQRVEPGFDPRNVLTASVRVPGPRYSDQVQIANFFRRLEERVAAMPGVERVGAISKIPLSGSGPQTPYAWDQVTLQKWESISADWRWITPGYFSAIGAQLLDGRWFTEQDDAQHPGVAIVDESLAERAWPGESAVGKRLTINQQGEPWLQVVGVVKHIRAHDLSRPVREQIYLPQQQFFVRGMTLVVKTRPGAGNMAAALEREVHALDKDLPLYDVRPMSDYVAAATSQSQFTLLLVGIFGGLALLLTGIGIYGVVSHGVAQRGHEIGVRMALGARRRDVFLMVVGQTAVVTAAGVAAGLPLALLLARFLRQLLVGITPADPLIAAVVALTLGLAALAASYLPARRAASVDPMVALRYE